jgi:hypothetical protein
MPGALAKPRLMPTAALALGSRQAIARTSTGRMSGSLQPAPMGWQARLHAMPSGRPEARGRASHHPGQRAHEGRSAGRGRPPRAPPPAEATGEATAAPRVPLRAASPWLPGTAKAESRAAAAAAPNARPRRLPAEATRQATKLPQGWWAPAGMGGGTEAGRARSRSRRFAGPHVRAKTARSESKRARRRERDGAN